MKVVYDKGYRTGLSKRGPGKRVPNYGGHVGLEAGKQVGRSARYAKRKKR